MRKTVFTLWMMALTVGLQASPVTPSRALDVAARFFEAQTPTKATPAGALSIIWNGEEATKAPVDPAFYVVGREGGGFVIVAGDDCVSPIQGFSLDGNFGVEDMPCNVKLWMDNLKAHCRSARFATPEVVRQWAAFAVTKSKAITGTITREVKAGGKPWWTVEWGQQGASNLLCPVIGGSRAVCGCVPLALSEIMTWFGYPVQGKGTVSSYHSDTITIPEHELTTVYDWPGLQSLLSADDYRAQENTELGKNLGQLVYDVGTILRVTYGVDGTSGNESRVVEYLCEHMGYSRNVVELDHHDYNPTQWDDMLSRELEKHPVYYTGHDGDNGHAYVIDGYADFEEFGRVFHVNFGWYGSCNGYYMTDGQDSGGSKQNYRNNSALFDFEPDPSGTSDYVYSMHFVMDYNSNPGGGFSLVKPLADGQMVVNVTNAVNTGNSKTYFDLALLLEHPDGTVPPDTLMRRNGANMNPGSYWKSLDCELPIPSGVGFGDRIGFHGLLYGEEGIPVRFEDPSAGLSTWPLFPAAFIDTRNNPEDHWFYFRLINNDYAYPRAAWFITDSAGETQRYNQSDWRVYLPSGTYTVKAVTDVETIVATITVE